jgi:DNA repair exonuclease SbcCD ATPase subunit
MPDNGVQQQGQGEGLGDAAAASLRERSSSVRLGSPVRETAPATPTTARKRPHAQVMGDDAESSGKERLCELFDAECKRQALSMSEPLRGENARLQKQVADSDEQVKRMQKELIDKHADIEQKQKKLEEVLAKERMERDKLQKKCERQHQDILGVKKANSEVNRDLQKCKSELEGEKSANEAAAEREICLQAKLQAAQSEIEALTKDKKVWDEKVDTAISSLMSCREGNGASIPAARDEGNSA